jgi:hypothetical protein
MEKSVGPLPPAYGAEIRQRVKCMSCILPTDPLVFKHSGFHIYEWRNEMSLISVVITIAVVGILLWLINRFIPMQGQIKGILNAVVVIALVLWLLKIFGLFDYLSQFHVGHV